MQIDRVQDGERPLPFRTGRRTAEPTATAPDGSQVWLLGQMPGGGLAEFHLDAGRTARAVVHRTVDEIWYVTAGRGRIWRRQGEQEQVVELAPGVCVTIPVGTRFQFQASADDGVTVLGVTMPPWPGAEEAEFVDGPWAADANESPSDSFT